jgi:hypothetical protein
MKIVKTLLFSLMLLLFASDALAQVPQAFSYQAVARDASGEVIANSPISLQVKVVRGTEDGDVIYTETHNVTTSAIGSFSLEIGAGTPVGSTFGSIDWALDTYFLALAVDVTGGTTYVDLGATKVLSVPFALVSQRSIETDGTAEFPSFVLLNSDEGDTTVVIRTVGSKSLTGLRVSAETASINRGITGAAVSTVDNNFDQYGVQGLTTGTGTGAHLAVFGSAVNFDGTGGRRYGLYGQAGSQGIENLGAFGIAVGTGSGQIVPLGQEVNGNIGSVNAGVVGFASQNSNYNLGIRGRVYGTAGARINVGAQGMAEVNAAGGNVGVEAYAMNSQSSNTGYFASVNGSADNYGMRMYVDRNGSKSIGAEIHADTALYLHGYTFSHFGATFNGNVQVNGNLAYSGSLTNTSDRNLKENVRSLDNALGVVMQLRPTSYTFRGNGSYNGLALSTGQRFGLIAQEVETILPSLVQNNVHQYEEVIADGEGVAPGGEAKTVTREMEYKSLNYTEMIPFLIKAMQEQQEMIEKLQKEIEDLKRDK